MNNPTTKFEIFKQRILFRVTFFSRKKETIQGTKLFEIKFTKFYYKKQFSLKNCQQELKINKMWSNYFNLTVMAVFLLAFIIHIPGMTLDLIFLYFPNIFCFLFKKMFLNGMMIT